MLFVSVLVIVEVPVLTSVWTEEDVIVETLNVCDVVGVVLFVVAVVELVLVLDDVVFCGFGPGPR